MSNSTSPENGYRPLNGFPIGRYPLIFEIDQQMVSSLDHQDPLLSNGLVRVRVSVGGALLTVEQIKAGFDRRLYFPNNFQNHNPKEAWRITDELSKFVLNLKRGLLPANVLLWQDYRNAYGEVSVYRVNGFKPDTEMVMLNSGGRALVIDPEQGQFVPISTQYYR